MRADAETEKSIIDLLNKFADANAVKDLDYVQERLFVNSEDMVYVGPGKDERRIGFNDAKLQLQRDFGECDVINYMFSNHVISCSGGAAWVYADCEADAIAGKEEFTFTTRFTGVLVRGEDGRWKIAQVHFSIPVENNGHSFEGKAPPVKM